MSTPLKYCSHDLWSSLSLFIFLNRNLRSCHMTELNLSIFCLPGPRKRIWSPDGCCDLCWEKADQDAEWAQCCGCFARSWLQARLKQDVSALPWEKQLCDYPHLLGFRWVCDDSVTHYIYQGRVGDNSREYRGVKERGLRVVSQCWLHAVCFHGISMQVVEVFKFMANKWLMSCRAVCWGTKACSRVSVSIQLQPKNEPEP